MWSKADLQAALHHVADEHGVTVLFAAEGGSRAWGMASANSDYDVRFVYAHPPHEYLTNGSPLDNISETRQDIMDIVGWDVRKTLGLLRRGNVAIYEWLRSPDLYVETPWSKLLLAVALQYFQPRACIFHYYGLAYRNYKAYLANTDPVNTKKYLYVLRSVLCCRWAEVMGTPPPVAFSVMLDYLCDDVQHDILDQTHKLIRRKQEGEEMGLEPPNSLLNAYIEGELKRFKTKAEGMAHGVKPDQDVLKLLMLSALGTEAMVTR